MDSTNIVQYMGASFLVLSLLRLMGIEIDLVFVVFYSCAALFFCLFDVWNFLHKIHKKTTKPQPDWWLIKIVRNERVGDCLIYASALCIIAFPHFPFFRNMNWLSKLGDFSTLFALGSTLILMGVKKLGEDNLADGRDDEIALLKQKIEAMQLELSATKENGAEFGGN